MINRFSCFEDYQIGMKGVTVPRTVTECDIVTFACQTGDYSQMHMDRHYAANLVYGDRIAHGLLAASFAIGGVSTHAPHILGRENPNAWFQDFAVDYRDVVRVGDTIRTEWHITDKVTDPEVTGLHSVRTSLRVFNQDSNLVAEGLVTLRIADKHANPAELIPKPVEPWILTQLASDTDQVLYAEDYTPDGQAGETEGRTITEADIVNFCGFTGDNNPQYMDASFAMRSPFKERIAPPMLGFNLAFAYWLREWLRIPKPEGEFAGHVNDRWIFLAPVKIGDTIRCKYKTLSTRNSRSKPGLGLLTFGLQIVNDRDEAVQEGSVVMMYPSRPVTSNSSTGS